MDKKILLLLGITLMAGMIRVSAQPGKPLVYALKLQALEKNRNRIRGKDPSIMPAYKLLIKDADKALDFGPVSVMEKKNNPPSGDKHDYMSLAPYHWPDPEKPGGLPYIRKDGQTNPEVLEYKDKEYMPKLCDVVHTLALAYYFSGENKYAEHAGRLLQVWFLDSATKMNPNLNFAQAIKGENAGRGAGIIDSRHFIKLVDAIGLLQASKAWTPVRQQGMKQWFSDFLQWMQTSKNGIDEMNKDNNHGAWYDAERLSLALFTGNRDLAKRIVLNVQDRLDKQMDKNGNFPKELERTTSLHYTVFAMTAFFTIADMAEKTGSDCWTLTTPSGNSLKKGFDVLKPFIAMKKNWEGQQIKDYDQEESYFLLMEAAAHLGCKDCEGIVRSLAADKAERLHINLLY